MCTLNHVVEARYTYFVAVIQRMTHTLVSTERHTYRGYNFSTPLNDMINWWSNDHKIEY